MEDDVADEVTSILMEEEKYILHRWEEQDILVKDKNDTVGQLVSEIVLSLRCFLIDKRVIELQEKTLENKDGNSESWRRL